MYDSLEFKGSLGFWKKENVVEKKKKKQRFLFRSFLQVQLIKTALRLFVFINNQVTTWELDNSWRPVAYHGVRIFLIEMLSRPLHVYYGAILISQQDVRLLPGYFLQSNCLKYLLGEKKGILQQKILFLPSWKNSRFFQEILDIGRERRHLEVSPFYKKFGNFCWFDNFS